MPSTPSFIDNVEILSDYFRYRDGVLHCGEMSLGMIAQAVDTPTYVYSLGQIKHNYQALERALEKVKARTHIHYSIKANGNLSLLRYIASLGAGMDAVSAGEIFRAIQAGVNAQDIVFAGVGKTLEEIGYAVECGVGWFNIENVQECAYIQQASAAQGRTQSVALRLNPEVTASTHPYIATGHGGAKFGLTEESINAILSNQERYPNLDFAGLHVHIGSQLNDLNGTHNALDKIVRIAKRYKINKINIGGGFPVQYHPSDNFPGIEAFAQIIDAAVDDDFDVLLEPGRSIVGNAGALITRVIYLKEQGGEQFIIVDAGMTELIRPALYQAYHAIVPVCIRSDQPEKAFQIVGPVCETTDILGRSTVTQTPKVGDVLAILSAGAYGSVMSSNYNARLRPAEVAVATDGNEWESIRERETYADLIKSESLT